MRLIIIVDDRSTNRTIFARLAMTLGTDVQVETFASPQDALAWCTDNRVPDLIITDYKMPGMDGATFTSRIRDMDWDYNIPIIVVTAYEDRNFRLRALDAGATDFLLSPVDHTEFLTRARNLLQLSWHQRQTQSRAQRLEHELQSSRQARDEALRGSRDRLLQVIDTIPAMISATDDAGRYIFVNKFHARVLGEQPVRGDMAQINQNRQILDSGQPTAQYEESLSDRYGVERVLLTSKIPLHDETNDIRYVLTTSLDITDRKKAEWELHHLAYHDKLTGLPNRSKVEHDIDALLRSQPGDPRPFAFLILDLSRFKGVNDTHGHSVGDMLLRKVALRLRTLLPKARLVARLGGDEFAIAHDICDITDAQAMAMRIIEAFERPFFVNKRELNIGISVGITLFPDSDATFETLLKRADLAMYRAKSEGGCRFAFFDDMLEHSFAATVELEQSLRDATTRNEFVLHYQPAIDLENGVICGVEALIRWEHPNGQLIYPGHFLPMAEETGLIVPMTIWSLNEACRQAAQWQREGYAVRMAVNISGVLFHRHNVHDLVIIAINNNGLDPKLLELELTETVLIENQDAARHQLAALQRLGVSVAIDDFGTGYASLAYLARLPIQRLKIDRTFIHDLLISTDTQAIVRSIILLARSLGIKVIAEGIEDEAQLIWLRQHGCQEAQGFLFSKAVPSAQVTNLFHSGPINFAGRSQGAGNPTND